MRDAHLVSEAESVVGYLNRLGGRFAAHDATVLGPIMDCLRGGATPEQCCFVARQSVWRHGLQHPRDMFAPEVFGAMLKLHPMRYHGWDVEAHEASKRREREREREKER